MTKHSHVTGGRLSTSAIVTDVDVSMRRAKKLPGPGAYDVSAYGSKKTGGRFSTAKPKTDVEWIMHRAKQIPGPGEYDRRLPAPSGGKFGASSPKTNLEEIMHRAAKLPGPGMYDSDIYSISKRTGAVPPYPSSAPPSKPATAQSEHSGIPPEARRKPKPKKQDQEEAPAGPRPHTSLGITTDGAAGEVHRGRMQELEPLSEKQAKHKAPWYKRGLSRDGALRSPSPAKWNIPESAQRAYGVWLDELPRKKKPKGRSKARGDGIYARLRARLTANALARLTPACGPRRAGGLFRGRECPHGISHVRRSGVGQARKRACDCTHGCPVYARALSGHLCLCSENPKLLSR